MGSAPRRVHGLSCTASGAARKLPPLLQRRQAARPCHAPCPARTGAVGGAGGVGGAQREQLQVDDDVPGVPGNERRNRSNEKQSVV